MAAPAVCWQSSRDAKSWSGAASSLAVGGALLSKSVCDSSLVIRPVVCVHWDAGAAARVSDGGEPGRRNRRWATGGGLAGGGLTDPPLLHVSAEVVRMFSAACACIHQKDCKQDEHSII
jgi:hypothetical protein